MRRRWSIPHVLLAFAMIASLAPIAQRTLTFAAGSRRPAGSVGEVRYIVNGLNVQVPRQPARAGHMKEALFAGYGLTTRTRERAALRFGDGTTVHMNQETDIVLRSPNVTEVRRGQVAEYLKPGTDHQVMTAAAVASAPGTTFGVKLQGNLSIFIVLRGKLRVGNKQGFVLVGSNQASNVLKNKKPGKPYSINAAEEFTWTDDLPTPDLGQNVALDSNGAKVLGFSSQRGGMWPAKHINDGSITNGWESADGKVRNQTIKIGFGAKQQYQIAAVVIDPAATHGDPSSMDLKDFEVLVSSTGPSEGDFIPVLRGHCERQARLQTFLLPVEVQARYLELRAKSNFGNTQRIAVAELEVLAPTASFSGPEGAAVDPAGNVYVADTSNFRVVKLSPMGQILTSWGSKGNGPGQFISPSDVALGPNGEVYVLDYGNGTVQEFSPDGVLRNRWGSSGTGQGQLYYPLGLTVDAQGNIDVADSGNNRIEKFSASGDYLASFGTKGTMPGQFIFPRRVAVDHEGNLYVTDQGITNGNRLQKLSPSGTPLPFPAIACQPAGSSTALPSGVAVDATDNLYVVDVRNHCLVKRSPSGELLKQWSVPQLYDKGFGAVDSPVAVDSHGTIYILDSLRPTLDRFSPNGDLLEQWGQFGELAHGVVGPQDLAIDVHNHTYISDANAGWVQERGPSGRILAIVGRRGLIGGVKAVLGELVFPRGLAIDARGQVYIAARDAKRLQVYTNKGAVRFFPQRPVFRDPYGVAIDHHGNVYVSDSGDSVVKLSPTGAVLATLGTPGTYGAQPDQFDGAGFPAIDSHDNLYVPDQGNKRIKEYSPTGKLLAAWGSDQLNEPNGLAIDRQDNIYAADLEYGQVVKYSPTHRVLARWGTFGAGRDQLQFPYAVAVDSRGNVYVADYGNSRVVERAPDGRVIDIWE